MRELSNCPYDRFREQELLHEGVRVISVDNGVFIHAANPRHIETIVLLQKLNS